MTTSAPRFAPLKHATAYEQVAERIRAAILDRSLNAQSALPSERELATQFGVSRTTVREALRHLQAQGLLSARGRTSPLRAADPDVALGRFSEALSHVVQLRNVSLEELLELRFAVESAALVSAAQAPVEVRLEEARRALAIMAEPSATADEFYEADIAFHVALVASSGNEALRLVLLAVKDSLRQHLASTMRGRSFTKLRGSVLREHQQLLAAVENGRVKAVSALLRQHLDFYRT
jgi:DNA-binding FadR family transcriptional regulator